MSEVRDEPKDVLREKMTHASLTVTEVDVLLSNSKPEPKTRADVLKYSGEITIRPNTRLDII